MSLRIPIMFILLFLFFSLPTYAFNNIVVFGDSLSDNGNLYSHDAGLVPRSPPYFNGRFTNGDVWIDIASDYYKNRNGITIADYALGGETALYHNPLDGFVPYTLTTSVESYLLHTLLEDKADSLFIIWIGGNDYFYGASDNDELTKDVTDKIFNTVELLTQLGGKNFLVINVPDLSLSPYARSADNRNMFTELTRLHNVKLNQHLIEYQQKHPDVNIRVYDVNKIFLDLVTDPKPFNLKYNVNITDTTSPCWSGGYSFQANSNMQTDLHSAAFARFVGSSPDLMEAYKVGKHSSGQMCSNPENHIFWDHVHPTKEMHKIVAALLIEEIDHYFK